jgi:hypothetical protein
MSISKSYNTTEAVISAQKMTNKRIKVIVGPLVSVLILLVILTFSLLPLPSLAMAAYVDNSVKMTKQQSFIDSHGRLNIIGIVDDKLLHPSNGEF